MRVWGFRILGLVGVAVLLLGVLSFALTQTVRMRPFSWANYWRLTQPEWIFALVCLPAGFAVWRLATRELRAERERRTG